MQDHDETYVVGVDADLTSFNRAFKTASQTSDRFARSLTNAFVGLIVKGRSLGDTLKSLALRLSELALKAALKPLETLFSGAMQSLFAPAVPFAHGAVVQRGLPVPFARGGVVAAPTAFALAGGRTGLMGEAGPEAIMPLTRGADGRLGVRAAGQAGTPINVTFNVTAHDAESFRRSEAQISTMLARAVAQGRRNL